MSLSKFIPTKKILRSLDIVTENVTLKWKEVASLFGLHDDVFSNPRHIKIKKPVTAILIGAGHRGSIYADYAIEHPDEFKIVAVAEPDSKRSAKIKHKHKLKYS